MIKQIRPGDREYGFVSGPAGFIVSNDECIHSIYALDESADLNIGKAWEPEYKSFTLPELTALAGPDLSMFDWVHYWGIKQRMAGNYAGLLKSMREIGLDTKSMPKWGEDDRAPRRD